VYIACLFYLSVACCMAIIFLLAAAGTANTIQDEQTQYKMKKGCYHNCSWQLPQPLCHRELIARWVYSYDSFQAWGQCCVLYLGLGCSSETWTTIYSHDLGIGTILANKKLIVSQLIQQLYFTILHPIWAGQKTCRVLNHTWTSKRTHSMIFWWSHTTIWSQIQPPMVQVDWFWPVMASSYKQCSFWNQEGWQN
jgi:hypothetical protein